MQDRNRNLNPDSDSTSIALILSAYLPYHLLQWQMKIHKLYNYMNPLPNKALEAGFSHKSAQILKHNYMYKKNRQRIKSTSHLSWLLFEEHRGDYVLKKAVVRCCRSSCSGKLMILLKWRVVIIVLLRINGSCSQSGVWLVIEEIVSTERRLAEKIWWE